MRANDELANAFAAARVICRRNFRAIGLPAAFLPPEKRRGVFAVLALCQLIREASGGGPEVREMLGDRLRQLESGQIDLPDLEFRTEDQHALFAAAQTIRRFEIPAEWFSELSTALQNEAPRYATWVSLEKHLEGTGGSVAKIVAAVLGMTHSDGADRAGKLGVAIELTRILCKLKEDRDRRRILLPLADFASVGLPERELGEGVIDERFGRLIIIQVERAATLYDQSTEAIAWLADDGSRLFAASVIAAGETVLGRMQKGWRELFDRPPRLTTARMVRSLPRAWSLARR